MVVQELRQECKAGGGGVGGDTHSEEKDPTSLPPHRLTEARALPEGVTSQEQNACFRMGRRPQQQSLAWGPWVDCHRVSSSGWDGSVL